MGSFVRNFEELHYKLRRFVPEGRLCCFFAFDDRPSLTMALARLREYGRWVDTLAKETDVFAFVPVSAFDNQTEHFFVGERMMTREESEYAGSLPTIDYYLNPTIQLAARFGFLPRDLPGVILFRAQPDESQASACIISIPELALTDDASSFERYIAILFSELITSLHQSDRDDFRSIVSALQRTVTQGCTVKESGLTTHSALVAALESDLDSSRGQAYEPPDLERIFSRIPEQQRARIRIFLSYASEDRDTVRAFYDRLGRAGFSPWMDSENILPGERWEDRIAAAVRSANFVVFFISHRSTRKRGYIQKELRDILRMCEEQLDDDIYLIPVKIDNCEVPASLTSYQWLSFGRYQEGWARLFQALVAGYERRQH